MTTKEIIEFYKKQIEWYKGQIEWASKQIEWLNRHIKDEKYEWGYSLQGQAYIRQRAREYRSRKQYKLNILKYEKCLAELV